MALWALHFGLVGLHFLAFWPFRGQLLGPPPQVAKNSPFAERPYNGFIRAMTGSILQFLAFRAFISLHFGLVSLHFLAFWPCGSSFPCVLAFWAFISFHFGLVGLHFLAFWPFRGQLLGPPPQVAKNGPFAQRPYNGFSSAVTGPILQFFSLLGLHFLAFWPCGPSFPCILALWAFISLHFGLVGLHFLAFWPCGPSFPCILALWVFISFHFGLFGVGFWGPPRKLPKMARLPFSCQGRGFPYLLVFWWRSLQLCLLTFVSTGSTALPAMDAQAHACETSGTASPSPPQWWEDAAGVSHAPAPVLHREGLFGRTPTD